MWFQGKPSDLWRLLALDALVVAVVLLMAGCTTIVQGSGCPRLSHWSAEDQKALAVEYAKASPLVQRAIDDLKYMRDQTRACQGA